MQALSLPLSRPGGIGWFSIVGAPRCGTTSLARYLSGHSSICFSSPKEPHFFSRHELQDVSTPAGQMVIQANYLDRFFPDRSDDAVLAEGSVSYLYTPERMLPILDIWPDARFILAVRSPIEMLPSLHRRHIWNCDESEQDFARAWALVEDRRKGKNIPRTCLDPRVLDYKEIGQHGKHVRRFFDVVGRDRCFVSVFDDLAERPREQLEEILRFLELPIELPEQFDVHRPAKQVRFEWLQRMLKRPPKPVRGMLAGDADILRDAKAEMSATRIGALGRLAMRGRKRMLTWNRTYRTPPSLDEKLRAEMCAFFHDDVVELSALVGRDLRHWVAD
jgi:hypothetical protein